MIVFKSRQHQRVPILGVEQDIGHITRLKYLTIEVRLVNSIANASQRRFRRVAVLLLLCAEVKCNDVRIGKFKGGSVYGKFGL